MMQFVLEPTPEPVVLGEGVVNLSSISAGPHIASRRLTPLTAPKNELDLSTASYPSGNHAGLAIYRTLRLCPGKIEAIEGSKVYATIMEGQNRLTAEFRTSDFEPGSPLHVGQGITCREFVLMDGSTRWSNEIFSTPPPDPAEVRRLVEETALKFEGSGL